MLISKKLAVAALAGLLTTGVITTTAQAGEHSGKTEKSGTTEPTKEKHACKGLNSCKGQGGDGKNACKGHGACATDGSKPKGKFPYIPGLLSFREIPAIIKVMEKLTHLPDLLMVDGHGIAHPRRMGIAAHLGVITNMPSIGVAKKRLTGQFEQPQSAKFSESKLYYKDELIGVVLQSRERTKPIFISPGNMIDIRSSLEIVKSCIIKHKLPEPTRLADKLSKFITCT